MAMALYPEVQKQAQQELDLVLRGALPTFADQGNLPYTSALAKEVFRWYPVTSLGQSTEPDPSDLDSTRIIQLYRTHSQKTMSMRACSYPEGVRCVCTATFPSSRPEGPQTTFRLRYLVTCGPSFMIQSSTQTQSRSTPRTSSRRTMAGHTRLRRVKAESRPSLR